MKRSVKYCCIVVIIAILVGLFTFVLFNSGLACINLANFVFFNFILSVISTAFLIALMRMQGMNNDGRMKNAYCCCGNLAAIGAAGSIIFAFVISLFGCGTGFLFFAEVALMFFFMVLMLGGIVCFLYTLNGCHSECIPDKPDCRPNHECNNTRDYNRKEFIYPNNSNNRR